MVSASALTTQRQSDPFHPFQIFPLLDAKTLQRLPICRGLNCISSKGASKARPPRLCR